MSPVLGIVIYWVLQIAVFIYALASLGRVRDEWSAAPARRDSRQKRILMFVLVPIVGFAYFVLPGLLGHKPLQQDRIWLAAVFSVLMSVSLLVRFRRQDRPPPVPAPIQPSYHYRVKDGSICGPDSRERILVLQRMGVIDTNTDVASYEKPEDWYPLSKHPDFQVSDT